jgi:hypothetical protein
MRNRLFLTKTLCKNNKFYNAKKPKAAFLSYLEEIKPRLTLSQQIAKYFAALFKVRKKLF